MPELPDDQERVTLRTQRQRLETLLAALVAPGSEPPPPAIPDDELVNAFAQYLDLDPIERQGLLERDGALSRSQTLIDLLEKKVTPPR